MTLEEAIKCIEEIKASAWGYHIGKEMLGIPYSEFIEILDTALTALRPVSREQVEKAWRGEWEFPIFTDAEDGLDPRVKCSVCGNIEAAFVRWKFCPNCGAPMTDEAMQMVMERMEAMKDG